MYLYYDLAAHCSISILTSDNPNTEMYAIFIAGCFVNLVSHTDDTGSIFTLCKECDFMTPER
ncbi:hypothetical protein COD82_24875 [Bacillus cereus]|nr:hypothetical protein CON57_24785 [Bacillus cereus]PEZ17098.1 hypothetical protein CN365_20365 [Bacillus cereus]PEZ94860.1 hypothetical protein CN375_20860 [Bacillus cereus]PFL29381.1 hypothetical protein COJ16_27595 [Bacillus cereus]PFQ02692.1 hypothetical protein COK12_21320 [Bacillus cereus]